MLHDAAFVLRALHLAPHRTLAPARPSSKSVPDMQTTCCPTHSTCTTSLPSRLRRRRLLMDDLAADVSPSTGGCRVVAYDRPPYGLSQRPLGGWKSDGENPYTLQGGGRDMENLPYHSLSFEHDCGHAGTLLRHSLYFCHTVQAASHWLALVLVPLSERYLLPGALALVLAVK